MVHKAERGLFELRQGRALYVASPDTGGAVLVAAVEGLEAERLEEIRSLGVPLRLVVTHHRGLAMGLSATNGGAPPQLSLGLDRDATPDRILRMTTATGEKAGPDVRAASPAEAAGLALTRLGHLLPAVVSVSLDAASTPRLARWLEQGEILEVSSAEIERMVAKPDIQVTHVIQAPVPLEDTEDAVFVFFREGNGFLEHVAVLIGDRADWPDPVPVRLHSACLTGDLFGSLRCDCGAQLRGALTHFTTQGGGVLVYLAQEGRGIGLGNKIRAYTLQQEGMDTVDADGQLGFGADERRYDAAVAILRHLEIDRVQLLTNNPDKVRALEESGIQVVDRKPIHGRLNRHNLPYVQAKVDRAGHWLRDMMSQRISGD